MNEGKNIWCVTGFSGSGKTHLGEEIAETVGGTFIERDAVAREIARDLFHDEESLRGAQGLMKLLRQGEFHKVGTEIQTGFVAYAAEVAPAIRQAILELITFLEHHPELKESQNAFIEFLDKLLEYDDPNLVMNVSEAKHFSPFKYHLATKRSIDYALAGSGIQLIETPDLVFEKNRTILRQYLLERGADPSLFIIQNTRTELLRQAEIREDESPSKPGRASIEHVLRIHDPYRRAEGWRQVITLNNSPSLNRLPGERRVVTRGLISDIRGKLRSFRPDAIQIPETIPFVLE